VVGIARSSAWICEDVQIVVDGAQVTLLSCVR
jgi:hypothetical protein